MSHALIHKHAKIGTSTSKLLCWLAQDSILQNFLRHAIGSSQARCRTARTVAEAHALPRGDQLRRAAHHLAEELQVHVLLVLHRLPDPTLAHLGHTLAAIKEKKNPRYMSSLSFTACPIPPPHSQ